MHAVRLVWKRVRLAGALALTLAASSIGDIASPASGVSTPVYQSS